ncbi:MAG: hypothetical protein KGK08_04300 [Acidobacteriota bacterium]|nr:hypothetical protein [Acidobacteriota bacterium]
MHAGDTLQTRTLRTYTVLSHLHPHWGGRLAVCCSLDPEGQAASLAVNIAGGVSLAIEEDAERAHKALRSGVCDFVVNTLDEALRTMKNEVRKHTPLSVGLQAPLMPTLDELLERGVAPQVYCPVPQLPATYAQRFLAGGAQVLSLYQAAVAGALVQDDMLTDLTAQHSWQLCSFPLADQATLRSVQERLLEIVPADDLLRRRWLQTAHRVLPRELPQTRALWLTPEEQQRWSAITIARNIAMAV